MNSLLRLLLASSVVLAPGSLTSAAEDSAPANKPSGGLGKYELQHKSVFTLTPETRPPFWPVGWVKRQGSAETVAPVVVKPKLDERSFNLTSVLLGNPALAIVNGRTYSEGEFIRMPKGAPAVRIRVLRISDGSVTLQSDNQMLVIPLRRPELLEKKPDVELNTDQ